MYPIIRTVVFYRVVPRVSYWTKGPALAAGVTTWTIPDIFENCTSYQILIRFVTSNSETANSQPTIITTPCPPSTSTNSTATVTTSTTPTTVGTGPFGYPCFANFECYSNLCGYPVPYVCGSCTSRSQCDQGVGCFGGICLKS